MPWGVTVDACSIKNWTGKGGRLQLLLTISMLDKKLGIPVLLYSLFIPPMATRRFSKRIIYRRFFRSSVENMIHTLWKNSNYFILIFTTAFVCIALLSFFRNSNTIITMSRRRWIVAFAFSYLYSCATAFGTWGIRAPWSPLTVN